jgi:hypothetical protein
VEGARRYIEAGDVVDRPRDAPARGSPPVSPRPSSDRLGEIATKGVHWGLRWVAMAPEHVEARRLVSALRDRVPPVSAGRVLFVTPRDWAAHVQWEAMFGQALRLRGADVRYVTCGGDLEICDRANTWEAPPMPCRSCRHYVRTSLTAHGLPHDALWDQPPETAWPELDALGLDALPGVELDGLPLGRLVEIPVKWFLMRSDIEHDPIAALTYRRFLRSARVIADGMRAAFDRHEPDVVVACNGLFLFEAIALALCKQRGIDFVTYERGFIKETLIFRRGEPACLLDFSDVWSRWRDVPLTAAEDAQLDEYLGDRRHGRKTIDRFWKDPQFVGVERRGSGRLATLFTNLTWDSAVIGRERAFASMRDWIAATVELFAERPDDELVIRVHPAELRLPGKTTREPVAPFLASRFDRLPPNVTILGPEDDRSSYSLMEQSDIGLVYTSTTGLELAVAGTPVVVAGETHYRDQGFTLDAASPAEYRDVVTALLDAPESYRPDVEMARRYAYFFFFRNPVGTPGVEEHVLGLARITATAADLAPGAHADLDRVCDGILREGDFGP